MRKKTVIAWVTGAVMVLGLGAVMPFAQAGTESSGGASTRRLDPPDATWTEHWFEHKQTVDLVGYNDTVALYFDQGVSRAAVDWMLPYVTKVWEYTKSTYAVPDSTMLEDRLYVVIHQNADPDDNSSAGHPATRYDPDHDNRNAIDVNGTGWDRPQPEVITHEIGHIVEDAASGYYLSPAFALWGDSKWCEFFVYDVYTALGVDGVDEVFTRFSNADIDTPRSNSFWFRDFFHPLWKTYGKGAVMARYFRVLGENYPRDGDTLFGDLTLGAFIAYVAKAAGADVRPLATTAFGWSEQDEADYHQTRSEHPGLVF